ncbi:hypothetical protein CF327_g7721 [Tilletia walkeri]|nr:hypothetical protein CF327_g7721 [Tilletia walkeri]
MRRAALSFKGFGIRLGTCQGDRLPSEEEAPREDTIRALVQYTDVNGHIVDWSGLAKDVRSFDQTLYAADDQLGSPLGRMVC